MGFCTEERAKGFLQIVPGVEKAVIVSGTIRLKYWLDAGPEEQARRMQAHIKDKRKICKFSPIDMKQYLH